MKYLAEYRDAEAARRLAQEISGAVTRPWTLMEVCGGQTHAIMRHGIDALLPPEINLIHGPGCPVCVTPLEIIDLAHSIAARPDVIFMTFADMLRVPGSRTDLFGIKADGGDIRTLLSPLEALAVAESRPDRDVVLFAVGFETTAPATAMAVAQAAARGLDNFSVLAAHVRVPPALERILSTPGNRVQGFLAAGHVCAIMGTDEYVELVDRFEVPVVVTGFEPLDLLDGILRAVRQLEAGSPRLENAYERAVHSGGNETARNLLATVFEHRERRWRGLGGIPDSGLVLRSSYATFDAEQRFGHPTTVTEDTGPCISGRVLTGLSRPTDCPEFGRRCRPEHPLGATMVSGEGACAAYYRYRAGAGR